jgi:hypothetical protein
MTLVWAGERIYPHAHRWADGSYQAVIPPGNRAVVQFYVATDRAGGVGLPGSRL